MVDTPALGAGAARHGGSSPLPRTILTSFNVGARGLEHYMFSTRSGYFSFFKIPLNSFKSYSFCIRERCALASTFFTSFNVGARGLEHYMFSTRSGYFSFFKIPLNSFKSCSFCIRERCALASTFFTLFNVGARGLEPPCHYWLTDLNRTRLPISPRAQIILTHKTNM